MTEVIRIPRTLDAAVSALKGIESVLMVKKWGRAAILSCYVHDGRQSADSSTGIRSPGWTVTEFAKLQIPGLSSPTTIIAYREAYKQAVEEGYAKKVRPGQEVELPDPKLHPFPPVVSEGDPRYLAITDRDAIRAQAEADGTGPAKALDIAKNKKAMIAAIVSSDDVAAAALEGLGRRPITEKEAEVTLERVARAHPDIVEVRGVGIREDRNRLAFEEIRQEREASGDDPTTNALDLLSQRDVGAEGVSLLHQIMIRLRALGHLRPEATEEDQELILESFTRINAFAEHVFALWSGPNADLDAEFRKLSEEMGNEPS